MSTKVKPIITPKYRYIREILWQIWNPRTLKWGDGVGHFKFPKKYVIFGQIPLWPSDFFSLNTSGPRQDINIWLMSTMTITTNALDSYVGPTIFFWMCPPAHLSCKLGFIDHVLIAKMAQKFAWTSCWLSSVSSSKVHYPPPPFIQTHIWCTFLTSSACLSKLLYIKLPFPTHQFG